jgi:hypothetical protein
MNEYSITIEAEKKDEFVSISKFLFNQYGIKADLFQFENDIGFKATFECDYPGINIIEDLVYLE